MLVGTSNPPHGRGSLRVGLVLRPRLLECRKLPAGGIDGNDLWKAVERDLEAPRIVNLRHETNVGERDLVAERITLCADQRLDCVEAVDDPVAIPGIDLLLRLTELVLEIAQRPHIVERMDVAGDHLRNRAHLRTFHALARQQRRVGMHLIEIFDDGKRLNEHIAAIELERGHPHLRVDGAKLRLPVESAFLLQVDGDHVGDEALEVERDANPIGRGRAKIGVERHGFSSPCATSSAERRVNSLMARSKAGRSAGSTTADNRFMKSSARGASSSYTERPAGVRVRNDSRRSARFARRAMNLRSSSCATARETLVLCMWVCAPIALPVITPFSPRITNTLHSGIPILKPP